uniref:Uncharacterized protein n=1 Tax=Arundo donax TaxID=35708 RepID=A0A0A9ASX9_ARUDO
MMCHAPKLPTKLDRTGMFIVALDLLPNTFL